MAVRRNVEWPNDGVNWRSGRASGPSQAGVAILRFEPRAGLGRRRRGCWCGRAYGSMTLIPTTLHGDNDAHRARRGSRRGADPRPARVGAYRTMLLSRRLDDKEIQLKRQNKIFFQISGAGHEAVLTAAGLVLRPGYDWFYLYYRDRALCLQLGVTPAEMLLRGGRRGERSRAPAAGRCRATGGTSSSTSSRRRRRRARSSCRRSGCAEASLRAKLLGITDGFEKDEVVLVSTGDGTTSEGEFWESLNTRVQSQAAGRLPRRGQRLRDLGSGRGQHGRAASISKLVASFPGPATSRKSTAATSSRATRR